jgi:hypothetical protein
MRITLTLDGEPWLRMSRPRALDEAERAELEAEVRALLAEHGGNLAELERRALAQLGRLLNGEEGRP